MSYIDNVNCQFVENTNEKMWMRAACTVLQGWAMPTLLLSFDRLRANGVVNVWHWITEYIHVICPVIMGDRFIGSSPDLVG